MLRGSTSRRRSLRWVLVALVVTAGLVPTLTACNPLGDDKKASPKSSSVAPPPLTNDFADSSAVRSVAVPDLPVGLSVKYQAVNYDTNQWRLTDDKSIRIEVKLAANPPADMTVFVTGVKAEAQLLSTKRSLQGVRFDSADLANDEPGLLTAGNANQGVFAITSVIRASGMAGVWTAAQGKTAGREIPNGTAMTEDTLRNEGGVYGVRLTFTFVLMEKRKTAAGPVWKAATDVVNVPVS